MTHISRSVLTTIVAGAAICLSSHAAAFDADAAQKLAKSNDCFKCHAIDKTKKGPSFKKISAKLREKEKDPIAKIMKHMKAGDKVKLEDGTEEDHKIIETDDQKAMRNLAEWIMAQ